MKSGKFIFESFKKYLIDNNKINEDWNSLNILSKHAATVGGFDLDIVSAENNLTLETLKKNNFEIVFLIGQDNINFKKKNEFIIYIGSHGDKGAELSDIVLPGAAYTEQDAHFVNLEGKIQKAYQASFPPGEAKEDYQIFNELSELLKRKKLFRDKEELTDNLLNYLDIKKKKETLNDCIIPDFIEEKIIVDEIDYYYSNVVARASKTMSECRNSKINVKRTGTEG
tara:strand:- start:708 stop:1385 length:678 start_codon:yes stop_codon:yes gene_type:complete